LPTDLRRRLRDVVPLPPPLTIAAEDNLPAQVLLPLGCRSEEAEEAELRERHGERAALRDVKAVLRLIDGGGVKVGEKPRRPSQAALKAIAAVLSEGDFYDDGDRNDYRGDPAHDLTIKAFAWPMLLQAAGLAAAVGPKLQLTATGRKATTSPAHE